MIKLENDNLIVEILEKGAELYKIYSKEHNIDYLWDGKKEWWKGRSPLLFPIVGGTKGLKIEKKLYPLVKHGFAKDSNFKSSQTESDFCELSLTFSENTYRDYPYKFKLIVRYKIIYNSLKVTFKIINLDIKDIFYSIGGHPGFSLNLLDGDSPNDYYLEFSENEKLISKYQIRKDTLAEKSNLKIGQMIITNLPNKFTQDALIFQNLKSSKVRLLSKYHFHGIELNFGAFEYLGLWAKAGAPYICIEPWNGINDIFDFNGPIENKQGIKKLKEGKTESFSYDISCF